MRTSLLMHQPQAEKLLRREYVFPVLFLSFIWLIMSDSVDSLG